MFCASRLTDAASHPVADAPARKRLVTTGLITVTAIITATTTFFESPALAQNACGATLLTPGSVERIIDARTMVLVDGREIRLAGIALPSASAMTGRAELAGPFESRARSLLQELVGRSELSLRADTSTLDRYGRQLAFAYVAREGLERLLQQDMLSLGLALVAPRVGVPVCAKELLTLERAARAARVGIWADPGFVGDATQSAELLAQRGRLMLVEGRVLSVRESGGTIYVNFGRRWSEDFTVTIRKRDERGFVAAGLAPKQLERRRVRVRGFIEERGGPWIEARNAEDIEIIQD
jgi:endonuclease YncB( thermonuclease family)